MHAASVLPEIQPEQERETAHEGYIGGHQGIAVLGLHQIGEGTMPDVPEGLYALHQRQAYAQSSSETMSEATLRRIGDVTVDAADEWHPRVYIARIRATRSNT